MTPGLATVLMSEDPASRTYVSMKQRDCEELGMNAVDIVIDPLPLLKNSIRLLTH